MQDSYTDGHMIIFRLLINMLQIGGDNDSSGGSSRSGFLLGRTCCLSTHFVSGKLVRHNFKVLHSHHVFIVKQYFILNLLARL